MNRVRKIGFAASHIVVGFIGLLLATRGSVSAPEHPEVSSPRVTERPDRSRESGRSSNSSRPLRPLGDWRGSEYTKAWIAVRGAKLNTKDRIQIQRELLKGWAKVDLAAAMRAALEEAWDHDDTTNYRLDGPLIDAFSEAFGQNPTEAWDLICHGGFGIGSSLFRNVWIESVGRKNPLHLASTIKELSWRDREKAVAACFYGAHAANDGKKTLTKVFHQLAALPADIVSAEKLSDFLMATGKNLEVSALREELLRGVNPDDRLALAKAVVMGKLLVHASIEEVTSALADLPGGIKQEALWSALNSGFPSGGDKITGLIDLLIAENAWEKLNDGEVGSILRKASQNGEARHVADWVTNLPYRKESTPVFHRGVETYIGQNMDTSKEWIASIPSPEWRDRAYAEYSQQALNAKKDPAASRWALDQIRDPGFQAEAERWRKDWEKRNTPQSK